MLLSRVYSVCRLFSQSPISATLVQFNLESSLHNTYDKVGWSDRSVRILLFEVLTVEVCRDGEDSVVERGDLRQVAQLRLPVDVRDPQLVRPEVCARGCDGAFKQPAIDNGNMSQQCFEETTEFATASSHGMSFARNLQGETGLNKPSLLHVCFMNELELL